jgi:hypothetical protein
MDSSKVQPSRQVSSPAGSDLGGYPQTTPKNPSQSNGNNPPKIPPGHKSSGMNGGAEGKD